MKQESLVSYFGPALEIQEKNSLKVKVSENTYRKEYKILGGRLPFNIQRDSSAEDIIEMLNLPNKPDNTGYIQYDDNGVLDGIHVSKLSEETCRYIDSHK